jgi:recombinational DNA repair ATPase RecF
MPVADPTLLHTLTVEGFRAYLQPKTFDLSKKPCLVIFAPNGLGKSSVIDALEFLFSEHGTLERLGQRTLNNQAGPAGTRTQWCAGGGHHTCGQIYDDHR